MNTIFEITRRGAIAAFGNPKALKVVMEQAFHRAGDYWGSHFLMKHFTSAGAREYGYAPRKNERARRGGKRFARTAGSAEQRAGEILPLVWSGDLKRQASTYRVKAVATSNQVYAEVAMPNARGINRLPAEYRHDLVQISPAEMRVLADLINLELLKRLNRMTTTQRIRI